MATRFYLPSTGAAEVGPAFDSWDKVSGASSALKAVRSRISSAMATVTNTKDNTTLHSSLIRQYVTEPLGAQTITGTISGFIRCIESNVNFSACVAISIRACSEDGGTIRSPALLAITNSDLYTGAQEMPTSIASRAFLDSTEANPTLTSCTLSEGDRLIIEIGFRASDTSTTRTGGISCGDDSATDISTSGSATANNPWVEFSQTLTLASPNRTVALQSTSPDIKATGSVGSPADRQITVALSGVEATGAVQSITPSISAALTGVQGGGGTSETPYALTQTLGGSLRSDYDYWLGFYFDTPSSNPPTVTALGRWKLSGNSKTHEIRLCGESNDYNYVASVVVDLSTGSVGSYVYGSVTPVTLQASHRYYLVCKESIADGDQFYDWAGTTLDSFTSGVGTELGAAYSDASTVLTGVAGAGKTFGPVNLKVQSIDSGVGTVTASVDTGPDRTVAITGVQATGEVQSPTASIAHSIASDFTATGSVGSVGRSLTFALSVPFQATGAVQTLPASSHSNALNSTNPDIKATGAVGSASPNITLALTGVQATGAVQSIAASISKALTNTSVLGTGSVDTVIASPSFTLSNFAATAEIGSVAAGLSPALSTVLATGSADAVKASLSLVLSGNEATGAVDSVTVQANDITLALTGIEATASIGSVLVSVSRGLIGVDAQTSVSCLFIDSGSAATQIVYNPDTGVAQFWLGFSDSVPERYIDSVATPSFSGGRSIHFHDEFPGTTLLWRDGVLSDSSRVSLYFRTAQVPADGHRSSILIPTNSSGPILLVLATTGSTTKLQLYDWISDYFVEGSATILPDTWYRISYAFRIISESPTLNEFRVFVNGTPDISVSNFPNIYFDPERRFVLGQRYWTQDVVDFYFQNIYVDNGRTLDDPGDIRVTAKRPASNSTNQFDTSIGANPSNRWENVNERPINEANGWRQNGSSVAIESYGIEGPAEGDVDITGAQIVARMPWVWAQLGTRTTVATDPAKLVDDGVEKVPINAALGLGQYDGGYVGAADTWYLVVTESNYPSNVGLRSTGTANDTYLFECGTQIAYRLDGPPTKPGITIALTGVLATTAIDSIASQASIALTGEQATGAVDSLVVEAHDVTLALTGVLATADVGSVVPQASVALLGSDAAVGSVDSITPAFSEALSGIEAASTVGSVGVALPISGNEATSAVDSVLPQVSIALFGVECVGEVGTIQASQEGIISLIGIEATSAINSLASSAITIALTGVETIGDVGSVVSGQAITGIQAAGEIESVGPSIQLALSGVFATGALGTEADNFAQPLTGNEATTVLGTIVPGIDLALTGSLATASIETLGRSVSIPLSGIAATGSVESTSSSITIALTGIEAAGAAGSVLATTALVGNSASGSVESPTAAIEIALEGISATGGIGTITTGSDVTTAITGASATAEVGDLSAALSASLSDVLATGSAGSVVGGQVISGVLATGDLQSPAANITIALAGVSTSGDVGMVSAGGDVTREITGVLAQASVGDLAPGISEPLTTVLATGFVDSLGIASKLTGVEATSEVNSAKADISIALAGVSATGLIGTESDSIQHALTGTQAAGSPGTVAAEFQLPISGHQATGAVGSARGAISIALTGVLATAAVDSVTPSQTSARALTGTLAAGGIAAPAPAETIAISGLLATGSAEAPKSKISIALTGIQATGEVGTVNSSVPGTASLSGISATAAIGSVSAKVSLALSGVEAAGAAGSVQPVTALLGIGVAASVGSSSPSITIALSGVQAAGDVGSVIAGLGLIGEAATGSTGAVAASVTIALTGVQGTSAIGRVIANGAYIEPISGVEASGSVGDLSIIDVGITLDGISATAHAESPGPSLEVGLSGVEAAGAVGNIIFVEIVFDVDNGNIFVEPERDTAWSESRGRTWRPS